MKGTFRKDLYFRLNVVTVHLPSLRERRSDIPMLVHHFLDRYAPDDASSGDTAAMKSLLQYDWPGNVRELENCVARASRWAISSTSTCKICRHPSAPSSQQAKR